MKGRKQHESQPSPELMQEIISRSLDKEIWRQRMKYLDRNQENIFALAKVMCAIFGRGAVWIGWPPTDFPSSNSIPHNVSYVSASKLRAQGMTSEHTTLQIIERYEPDSQAVVILIDEIGVAHINMMDSSARAGGLDRMKEQLGWPDMVEFGRERWPKGSK